MEFSFWRILSTHKRQVWNNGTLIKHISKKIPNNRDTRNLLSKNHKKNRNQKQEERYRIYLKGNGLIAYLCVPDTTKQESQMNLIKKTSVEELTRKRVVGETRKKSLCSSQMEKQGGNDASGTLYGCLSHKGQYILLCWIMGDALPMVDISLTIVQSTQVPWDKGIVITDYHRNMRQRLPGKCYLLQRKTFNVSVPNDSDVPSRFFVNLGQAIRLRRTPQTLVLQSKDNGLGGKLFLVFYRAQRKRLKSTINLKSARASEPSFFQEHTILPSKNV